MSEQRGRIIEERDDPTGKVSANIDIRKQDRRTSVIKIVIVSADTGETLFKAEYTTDKTSGLAAHTVASNIINTFCDAHNYIPTISNTGGGLPSISTIIRGSRW